MSGAKDHQTAAAYAVEYAPAPLPFKPELIASKPDAALPGWVYRLAYVGVIMLIAIGLAWILTAKWEIGRIDNGDGWRVLRRAAVFGSEQWSWQPLRLSYDMAPLTATTLFQSLPKATAGLLVFVLAMLHRCLGLTQFHVWPMASCYITLYILGAGCWIRSARTWPKRAALAALLSLLLLNPFTLSYFNSFYEEAAVLALMPWWTYETWRAFQEPRPTHLRWFYLSTAAMVLTKTQMAPVLLVVMALHLWRLRTLNWQLGLLVLCAVISTAKGAHQHEQYNAFNRLENGLAYSMSGVSDWTAHHHEARQIEAKQRVSWQSGLELGLPDHVRAGWGGSFWPEGAEMSEAERNAISQTGKAGVYLSVLWQHPVALWRVIKESYATATMADYTLTYLYMRDGQRAVSPPASGWQTTMAHMGWLYGLAICALGLAWWQRNMAAAALIAIIVVSPFFVVLGDGYYEFEKHLLPYLWLSIGIAAAFIMQTRPASAVR